MAKRIWKKKFNGYLSLISLPLLGTSVLLAFFPGVFVKYIAGNETATLLGSIPGSLALIRLSSAGFLFPAILLFTVQSSPNAYREVTFWIAMILLGIGAFMGAGPFLFQFTYFALAFPALFLPASLFLLSFVSRNLLIRE